jgi:purine nucleosidase
LSDSAWEDDPTPSPLPTVRPLVVDCDNTFGLSHGEIDDGLAILALLACPSVELTGICTTFGNGPLQHVTKCTEQLLTRIGRPDIAVHPGAACPGDYRTRAAKALTDLARRHEQRLSVVAIGSMANLHAASLLDSDFYRRLDAVYVMGGYLSPLRLRRIEVGELNLSADPAASYGVLNAPTEITVMSAQTCLAAHYKLRHLVRDLVTPAWFRSALLDWFVTFSRMYGTGGFYLWDLLPAIAAADPARFVPRPVRCTSTVAQLTRGELHVESSDEPPRRSGIVNIPLSIVGGSRFAADAARLWRATLARSER